MIKSDWITCVGQVAFAAFGLAVAAIALWMLLDFAFSH